MKRSTKRSAKRSTKSPRPVLDGLDYTVTLWGRHILAMLSALDNARDAVVAAAEREESGDEKTYDRLLDLETELTVAYNVLHDAQKRVKRTK